MYLFDIELFEHLFTAGRLFRFGDIGTEPLDKFEQFFSLFFGFLVLLLLLTQSQLAGFVPETVIPGEKLYFAEVDIYGVRTYRIEEVPVVRNDQYGIFEVGEVVFEPHHRFEVEVIGGLVEQQVVRVTEQCFCQQYPYFFLTAQIFHEHVVFVFLDTQSAEQGSCIAFGIPTFELGELLFEFGCADTVRIAEIGFGVQGIFFLHDVP